MTDGQQDPQESPAIRLFGGEAMDALREKHGGDLDNATCEEVADAIPLLPPAPDGLDRTDFINVSGGDCPECEAEFMAVVWENGEISFVNLCDDFPTEQMTMAIKAKIAEEVLGPRAHKEAIMGMVGAIEREDATAIPILVDWFDLPDPFEDEEAEGEGWRQSIPDEPDFS